MQEKFDLDFCFKGNRQYVQGPDIFDASVAIIANQFDIVKEIKYSAYAMLHKNATMYLTDEFVKEDFHVINSLISFIADNRKYYAVICENEKLIECSNDYSEAIVQNDSDIAENTISFSNILSDSFTEIVVSMNKHFLNQTVKENGKWIVTKFDYFNLEDIMHPEGKKIRLELVQNFNNKLTKSLLFLDDQHVGHLYFSLIPKES